MSKKNRLDLIMVERGIAASRQRAQSMIMTGKVLVDDHPIDKPGVQVSEDATIVFKGEDLPYVSRGGLKLEGALKSLNLNVHGLVCLDVGASTGGFTDCLLQNGARTVYAVDVGYGQLAWQLRQDSRVKVIERTNIRHLPPDGIPEPVDLITIDTSFISLRIVVPAACRFLKPNGLILALIKPQFEVGKGQVGKGGVVKDPHLQQEVIVSLKNIFKEQGFECGPVVPSPILGPKGNQEFIILLNNGNSV